MANIEEVLGAEDSAKWATLGNQQQYETPPWLVAEAAALLPNKRSTTHFDPQCAKGNLLQLGHWGYSYGVDIDNRLLGQGIPRILKTDCQKFFDIVDDIMSDLRFETFNANPPFGKRWSVDGEIVDSSKYTWDRALKHGRQGIFITNHSTAVKLGIDKHPMVLSYKTYENVWKDCNVVVGVAVWANPAAPAATPYYQVGQLFDNAYKILEDEKAERPPFNIWLNRHGKLGTYLSTRNELKHKLTRDQILQLHQIKNCHPLTLTTERETRKLLNELIDCGFYTIQPAALDAIKKALAEVAQIACPIMPVTDFERVAYAEEEDKLECVAAGGLPFTPGKFYEMTTASYSFTEKFKRNKVHFSEKDQETFTAVHDCTLSGQDRYIQVRDDYGTFHRFMDKPRATAKEEHEEAKLWEIFRKPEVKTLAEANPALVDSNKKLLRMCEMLAGYEYYHGQIDYLARVLCKDYGLIAAAVGTGKSLMAITIIASKAPTRALIIAPQGTMRSSGDENDEEEYQAAQWLVELRRFAPYLQIFELFSMADYHRIKGLNGGELPPGVYVTYYEAMFTNKARESAPDSWKDTDLAKNYPDFTIPESPNGEKRYIVESIGTEKNGIRCIVEPSMSTLIGHEFDAILLDEAHRCCNQSANMSQIMVRLQPKYRFALTATPIPNVVINLFNLMGWLCVPDWYKGDIRNAAWPYAKGDTGKFEATFQAKERDHTEEEMRREANPEWNGKCEKPSPVISSPARLLKIIRPTMAFISKEQVNAHYRKAELIDVRVPMGAQQAKLYGHFLDRGNIPCGNAMIRARKQIAYLRGICADPSGFDHHTEKSPVVLSNFNPKTLAILELIAEILERGEQVNCIMARIGQTNTIASKLQQCGIRFSRIDSTMPPEQHSAQANLFKQQKTRVNLMGIKCAVGHSFDLCPNEIIGSLEYSFASLEQARGRVDRVNSKRPAKIYCVLHKHSIEEMMFDQVGTKEDAAVICLRGQRIPRTFKPVDIGEVLANSIENFQENGAKDELTLESHWPLIAKKLKGARV